METRAVEGLRSHRADLSQNVSNDPSSGARECLEGKKNVRNVWYPRRENGRSDAPWAGKGWSSKYNERDPRRCRDGNIKMSDEGGVDLYLRKSERKRLRMGQPGSPERGQRRHVHIEQEGPFEALTGSMTPAKAPMAGAAPCRVKDD